MKNYVMLCICLDYVMFILYLNYVYAMLCLCYEKPKIKKTIVANPIVYIQKFIFFPNCFHIVHGYTYPTLLNRRQETIR